MDSRADTVSCKAESEPSSKKEPTLVIRFMGRYVRKSLGRLEVLNNLDRQQRILVFRYFVKYSTNLIVELWPLVFLEFVFWLSKIVFEQVK